MSANQSAEEYGLRMSRCAFDGGMVRRTIDLQRVEDRYTITSCTAAQMKRLGEMSSVHAIEPVSKDVVKVLTTAVARDESMRAVRSQGIVAHHAYRPKGQDGAIYYITDKIFVRLKKKPAPSKTLGEVKALFDLYRLAVIRNYPDGKTYLVQITSESGGNPLKVANWIAESDYVEWAEPNLINRFKAASKTAPGKEEQKVGMVEEIVAAPDITPPDPMFRDQWHLHTTGDVDIDPSASVDALGAWNRLGSYGSENIVVAVVDDGFDLTHPDFDPQKIYKPMDFVEGDENPSATWTTGDIHGTACAGLIVARANGGGATVGVAPGCRFMPVRMPMGVSDVQLGDLFRQVGAHADVISCSWAPPPVDAPAATVVLEALEEITTGGRKGKGCVVCFAAGNDAAPINDTPRDGFSWLTEDGVLRVTTGLIQNALALSPRAIVVTASTSLMTYAAYSNWGREGSLSGPSDNRDPRAAFGNTLPGRGIVTTDNEGAAWGYSFGQRYTQAFGGTSAANAIVAGVAALVLSANPELTSDEVKKILELTADPIPNPQERPFGRGKVNAARAVEAAAHAIKTFDEGDMGGPDDANAYPSEKLRLSVATCAAMSEEEYQQAVEAAGEEDWNRYVDEVIDIMITAFYDGIRQHGAPSDPSLPVDPQAVETFFGRYRNDFRKRLKKPEFQITERAKNYLIGAFQHVGSAARGIAMEQELQTITLDVLVMAHRPIAGNRKAVVARYNSMHAGARRLGTFCTCDD